MRFAPRALGLALCCLAGAAAARPPETRYTMTAERLGRQLDDAGFARWLATQPPGSGLVVLRLDHHRLTARSLSALAASKLGSPTQLTLDGNPIGDAGAEVIAAGEAFAQLRLLRAPRTGMTARGVRHLLAGGAAPKLLEELDLSGNKLGDAGVEAIAASPHAGTLGWLYLAGVGMTDRGARALAASAHLEALRHLTVSGNPITAAGIAALRKSPHLAHCEIEQNP